MFRKQRIAAWLAVALTASIGLAACSEGPHVIYGYMDAQGRWVVHPEYPAALEFSEGLAAVQEDGRWGYIGTQGQWVIEPRFDTATPFSEGLAAVETDDTWFFIYPTGTTAVPGPFEDAHPFSAGIAAIRIGNKWGFIDHAGREVVAPRFDKIADHAALDFGSHHIACFSEGLCAASQSGKWGYIERAGAWVITPRYEDAAAFREGLAAVREQTSTGRGKVGFIDRTGAWVIAPRFEDSLWFSGGRAIALVSRPHTGATQDDDGDSAGDLAAVMIDATGREVADVNWGPLLEGFPAVREVLMLIAPDYLADGLVPAARGDRWGFMDRKGSWAIEPTFAAVLPFVNGKAAAGVADEPGGDTFEPDRWGVIDTSGRWLIEPILEDIRGTGAATHLARLHGRWGVLDLDGQWRVPPRYAEEATWIRVPRELGVPGDGLQRVGVYANHTWIVADRDGRKSRPRELAWLTAVAGLAPGTPGVLAFLEGGSWGLADGQLRTVVPAQFDDEPTGHGESMFVVREGVEGCLDTRGRSVGFALCTQDGPPPPRRDGKVVEQIAPPAEIDRFYMRIGEESGGQWLARFQRGDAWGVMDERGRELLPPAYSAIGGAYDGLIAVRSGAQWRIVDLRGREVFPSRPEELAPFNRDIAVYCDAGLCGLLHRSGRVLVQPRYGAISPVSSREATVHMLKPSGEFESTGVIDSQGRLRVPLDYYTIGRFSEVLWLAWDSRGRHHLLDRSSGQPIAVSQRLVGQPAAMHEGLAAADLRMPDGSTAAGYLDFRGQIAIEPQFDTDGAGDFLRGAALVQRDSKCGLIDRRGRVVLPPQYDHCERLTDGRVIAGQEARWRSTEPQSGTAPR